MSVLHATNGQRAERRRMIAPWARAKDDDHTGLVTLIVGGGGAASTLAKDLRSSPDYGLHPIGCLDDNPRVRSVSGLPVLGRLSDLSHVVKEHEVEVVVIAIPSLHPASLSALIRKVTAAGVRVRYLPSFLAAVERDARAEDMRVVRFNALLGRQERSPLRPAVMNLITGARVLVTGAGGSIGQELCRQIRSCNPGGLYMLDHDESNLHKLQLELEGAALLDVAEIIVADIRDRIRIEQIMSAVRPQVVFHAAAHKHLPLLELHPGEGVKSNVMGTHNLVRAAVEGDVERFVLISTDKAADPRSILGATKRLAEMIVQKYALGTTRVCSVRFGNVLGSRGSLLSVVAEQLFRGEAVTITDPDVTRFFMTVEEAVGLVLSAASMAEFGETFVLDMGDPIKIVDLVGRYADQLHMANVTFRFTGLRPGEKLNEVLFSETEERLRTLDPAIWAAHPTRLPESFMDQVEGLYSAARAGCDGLVRENLADLLPDYTQYPSDTNERSAALSGAPYPDEF
ncbi:MAG: polysaccharide biosynthesis protein [Acidimicrobiales bacterium]